MRFRRHHSQALATWLRFGLYDVKRHDLRYRGMKVMLHLPVDEVESAFIPLANDKRYIIQSSSMKERSERLLPMTSSPRAIDFEKRTVQSLK